MQRETMITMIKDRGETPWDLLIIGGGATGLGIALDGSTRGYATLLLEQSDFTKGTSSRSTKLVHGGVRYLAQGNIALVMEALHERGLLRQNAPHLVKSQPFIIPVYNRWDGPFYGIGMKIYDLLAGKLGLSPSTRLTRDEVARAIPNLCRDGLLGGVVYYDGQFDDSRLAVNIAQTCAEQGGCLVNYMRVTGLLRSGGKVCGVTAVDEETGEEHSLFARSVINATGVFVDDILSMDDAGAPRLVSPSQGVHLVFDPSFLQGSAALMIPKTSDGRVLFAVPWHGRIIVGTTDTPLTSCSLEPRALEEEVGFILTTAGKYLAKKPQADDALSVFAGLRPLAASPRGKTSTKEISRSHHLQVSPSGLVTITGGKWTTYRKMAEDTIDLAIRTAGLRSGQCRTKDLHIHGSLGEVDFNDPLHIYGSDAAPLREGIAANPALGVPLHPALPFTPMEVIWSARHEMARTVEDILARRQRALFLDARAAVAMAPRVAAILAAELGRSAQWQERQVAVFNALAAGYYLH